MPCEPSGFSLQLVGRYGERTIGKLDHISIVVNDYFGISTATRFSDSFRIDRVNAALADYDVVYISVRHWNIMENTASA